jgi:calcineurin-like phosphoesterase family protein
MNDGLVERWNSVIKQEDDVYHLGDFAFAGKQKIFSLLERLSGSIHLIKGNHDALKIYKAAQEDGLIEWVRDYYVLRVQDVTQSDESDELISYHQSVVLCHFPILSWDNMHHGSWHLHGHCHGSLPPTKMMRMDAGVDANNWYPISYQEVKNVMVMRSVVPVDHHGA